MDSFEWNKVFAAVISGALLIMVISTVSGGLFPEYHGGTTGFPVEVVEATAGGDAAVEEGPSLAELLAVADVDRGAREFAKCKACHSINEGGKNGTGPNLYGILGKAIASDSTFNYSGGLSSHGGDWTYEALDTWLTAPKKMVADTSMSFAGLRKADKRANLIAYLRTLSNSPLALPEVAAKVEDAVEEAVEAVEDIAASN
ncbi:cytochrome c family protein [Kordiimonas sp. SCSIO 12610]|uniref:c-type cytochrome n=1 Tax=Kordiimonas sp. SCSIO 12610 TaxID=2829597 RepID=UPI002109176C|nr:cytochrome c family protein [Kordiimonas sp. SCSIO 12610]UTW55334.1 cytochrome c family protein [Kordiimonas sp. SCSIO 12610]